MTPQMRSRVQIAALTGAVGLIVYLAAILLQQNHDGGALPLQVVGILLLAAGAFLMMRAARTRR